MDKLSLATYDRNQLLGLDVKWNHNIFSFIKGVTVNLSPNHAFVLNDKEKRNSLFIKKGQVLDFVEYPEHKRSWVTTYARFGLTDNGKVLVTLEKIKLKNSFLGKDREFYRLGYLDIGGYTSVVIRGSILQANAYFNAKLNAHNDRDKKFNAFDRFMKKFFSFY